VSVQDHWLARPDTIRLLWRVFAAVLAVTVLAELFVTHEPHFSVEGVFGFGAWYGFLACAGLILFAKALGAFLKRPDTYYDGDGPDD
jgi:hypothetical protein